MINHTSIVRSLLSIFLKIDTCSDKFFFFLNCNLAGGELLIKKMQALHYWLRIETQISRTLSFARRKLWHLCWHFNAYINERFHSQSQIISIYTKVKYSQKKVVWVQLSSSWLLSDSGPFYWGLHHIAWWRLIKLPPI